MIAEGAPFETDWTLTNSGDAPADVTLTIAITPAGGVTSTATVEFEQAVVVGPGGGTFAFDLSAAQLAGQGIGGGEYTVSFVATDVFGNRVGAFFGNPLAIGQAEPGVSGAPAYDSTLNVGQAFSADWGLTNTGALNGLVTLLTVITPSGGVGREFYQAATIPPGGALIEQRIPASQLDARGIGAGQYTVAFILFDANDQRIAEFFGNPLTIGSAQPTLPAAPSYTNSITEGQNFVSNWAIGNTGDATAAVTLLTVITPTGTDNSREFYQPGSVPPGGATLEMVVTAQRLAGAGIGAGTYTVAFILFDAADNRVAQFFGNLLTISPGVTQQSSSSGPAASSSPTTIAVVAPGSDFVAPVPTQSFSQPSSGPVTLTALFTPQAGAQATGPLQVSRTFVLPPTGGLLDFRLTAGELSLLNLLPGLYRLDLLAFDGFGSLIDDNFFQALVEFLFG